MFKDFDYENLLPMIFRSLRGEQTQKAMDEELELPSSTYHRIESGYLKLKLDNFISLIYQLGQGSAWEKSLKEIANVSSNQSSAVALVTELIKVWGDPSAQSLESQLEFSSTKWWRIKNAKSIISAKDFFKLFEDRTGKLEWFLSSVFGVAINDSRGQTKLAYKDFTELVLSDPSYTVLTALMDSELNFADTRELLVEKFSKVLEKSFEATEERLRVLESMGLCVFENKQFVSRDHKLEIKTELGLGKKVFSYIADYMNQTEEENFRRKSYRISAVSEDCLNDIVEEQKSFYKKLHQRIEADSANKDHVLFFQSGIVVKKASK